MSLERKTEMLAELRAMLVDVFAARQNGQQYNRMARAHGYVDGYMRALLDLGVATKAELIEIVHDERERANSGSGVRPMRDCLAVAA